MSVAASPDHSPLDGAHGSPLSPVHDRAVLVLSLIEDLAHYAVALLLVGLAGIVLYNTTTNLLQPSHDYATRVIDGINGVLFVIIVMELLHTIVAHFKHGGFQLKPFLIIGIISAVRHILTIGARLTLTPEGAVAKAGEAVSSATAAAASVPFSHPQVELGVNTGVVVGLAISLLIVRTRPRGVEDDID
jgi:uncharacterized membrane protein (DUF373 family)